MAAAYLLRDSLIPRLVVVDNGETSRTSEPGYAPALDTRDGDLQPLQVSPEQEVGPQAGGRLASRRWVKPRRHDPMNTTRRRLAHFPAG